MADPAIKLFGKTIPLADAPPPSVDSSAVCAATFTISSPHDVTNEEPLSSHDNENDDTAKKKNTNLNDGENDDSEKVSSAEEENMLENLVIQAFDSDQDKGEQDGHTCHEGLSRLSPQFSENSSCQQPLVGTMDHLETLSGDKSEVETSEMEDEKTDTSVSQTVSQEKTLKKPDKILPCPRCNSMDTKFCYYNNYNVNQPRHFCKNCQRYWTAGGTMRNVPVGAGRRKNKGSATHFRHITVPEALQKARTDISNGVHPGLQSSSSVLTFGTDGPLCESMASVLNLAEKTMMNCASNGCQKQEGLEISMPFVAMETGRNHMEGTNSTENASQSAPNAPASQNCLPFPQMPCFPGGPWAYPWSSSQWSPPVVAPPFCPGGLALPFYPASAYCGYTVPGTWSLPMITQPSPPSLVSPTSEPNSPTLGKHSRDGNVLSSNGSEEKEKEREDTNCERSLWIPKTSRIDDPGEATKSSIWTTLGIKKSDKPESIGRGSGLFKAFNSKCNERTACVETSVVRESNPAALSRSQNFQENS